MTIPQSPSTLTVPVMRHKSYFIHEADVTIRVESYIFRIHRFFLIRESAYFRLRLSAPTLPGQDPPGSSESNPLVLDDATPDAFACFLWVFYNPKYSVYNATAEQWSSILDLSQKWGFKDVEWLCIRELEKLDLSPVDRIQIYQRFNLDDTLLLDCYESLTTRDEPIGVDEGVKLGLRTSLQIARAREVSRGPDTGGPRTPSAVQLKGPDLRLLISDIFQFPVTQSNGAAYTGPMTAPVKQSNRVDRASALPATAPTTPSKPEALSQNPSTSEKNPPSNDITSVKAPLPKHGDVTKGNPWERQNAMRRSGSSRTSN
ncbi:hypothetical protein BJV78DRAFT_1280015 [Lactifluus subvellereus]|nr:hypothetical protein BJV78DRAFT_1280015 [Lactifluus subvellereus]